MSVSVTYISEGNNVRGPEIGASGGLGMPSLDIEKIYDDDWGVYYYTFGWILSGLESIGLITEQVANFKEFLEENKDRNIYMFVEGGEDPNENKIDWDSISSFEPSEKNEFKLCSYKLINKASGDSYLFDNKDKVEKLIPCNKELSQDEIDNFIEKLVSPDMIDDSFHNQWGLLEPYEDFGQTRNFISNNRQDQLMLEISEI